MLLSNIIQVKMRKNKKKLTILICVFILFVVSIVVMFQINREKKEPFKNFTAVDQNNSRAQDADEGNWRIYEHWMDFSEERDLPYIDAEGLEVIRQAYAKVDFEGEFMQGDSENYDEYIIHFFELLNNDVPFQNIETGKEIYLEDFERLAIYEDAEYNQILFQCDYICFDIDNDAFPELGIRNGNDHNAVYIFDYNEEIKKCELWYTLENYWYVILGSRKIAWVWDDRYLAFYQINSDGKTECETLGISRWFNEEESLHMVMLPKYAEKGKEIHVSDWMKQQGVFSQADEQWFFRITEAQYEELMAPYWEAYFESQEEIQKVTYTYEELFGSLTP